MSEMSSVYNVAWLKAAVKAEAEATCDIQIGGKAPTVFPVDPDQLQVQLRRVKLHGLLLGEFKQVLQEVNFGSGFEAAYNCGHSLICERMQSLNPCEQHKLDQMMLQSAVSTEQHLKNQLRQLLFQLLNPADWQAIADSAQLALRHNLSHAVQGMHR